MYRLMDDRKKRIQTSKSFFDEFMKLMNHYELVDDTTKKQWKASIHPEEERGSPKLTAVEERNNKIEELKRKKLIQMKIEKLKDSQEDDDIREFWMSMISMAIMKTISAFKSIDMEFQLLVYRDSLPEEARRPSEKPTEPAKPLQVFHIPKGGLDGMPYIFGDASQAAPTVSNQPVSSAPIVKTFQETGERVTVNAHSNDINDRALLREQLKAQVFQPGWTQPTMSIEEFGDLEYGRMKEREAKEQALKEQEEAKDEETLEEEARQKLIQHDNM
mmetsp:Transcript_28713/g.32829  ORF Transcript_28713/g.32829 Transcript_28713/m.32829 type:complete len:274 (+) Transcript_28713:242-1063(+)